MENKQTIESLQNVIKKLNMKIAEYRKAGQIGYATSFILARRYIYFEIDAIKSADFTEKLKERRKIRAILKQEKV